MAQTLELLIRDDPATTAQAVQRQDLMPADHPVGKLSVGIIRR